MICTLGTMDVSVTELRAHLSEWLAIARKGEEVTITDRGIPIARLAGLDGTSAIERLVADGAIGRPRRPGRARATGRSRPAASESIARRVTDQRD